MTLVAGWATLAATQARQTRAAEDRLQAIWLAESAIDRAAARLQIDPAYSGETWQIAAEDFGRDSQTGLALSGVAVIAVEPDAKNATRRQVKVLADYPATGRRVNRVRKQIAVDLPEQGKTP